MKLHEKKAYTYIQTFFRRTIRNLSLMNSIPFRQVTASKQAKSQFWESEKEAKPSRNSKKIAPQKSTSENQWKQKSLTEQEHNKVEV